MVRVENPVEIFQYYLFKIRFKFSGIPVKTGKNSELQFNISLGSLIVYMVKGGSLCPIKNEN